MDARRERLGPRVHKHIFSSAPKIKYKIVERPALKDRRDAVGQLSRGICSLTTRLSAI